MAEDTAGNHFWGDAISEPKRAYRWQLSLGGIPAWIVKKVSKPSFTVSETEHVYLNHKFWYPGRVEWNTVSLTLADPVLPDAAETMMAIIDASGYKLPLTMHENKTMSKKSAVAALGGVLIKQIDHMGEIHETWELVNAWIKDVKFGELDYTSDDLVDIEVELRYDYAILNNNDSGARYKNQVDPANAGE